MSPDTQSYDQEGSVSPFAPVDSEFDPDVHYVPLKLEKTGAGAADSLNNTNREIVSQNNREPNSLSKYRPSPQTNKDKGYHIKILTDAVLVNKDDCSSVEEFFIY